MLEITAEDDVIDLQIVLLPGAIDVVDAKKQGEQAVRSVPSNRVLRDVVGRKSVIDLMNQINRLILTNGRRVHHRSGTREVVSIDLAFVVFERQVFYPIRPVGEGMVRRGRGVAEGIPEGIGVVWLRSSRVEAGVCVRVATDSSHQRGLFGVARLQSPTMRKSSRRLSSRSRSFRMSL